jgi:hypothetical protein
MIYIDLIKTWWANRKKPYVKITFRNMEGAFSHFVFDGEPLNVQLEYRAEQGFDLARMTDKPEKVPTRTITITVK